MNPRLKSSKKWTAFPKEYLQQLQDVFTQGFKAELNNAKLIIEGKIYPQEILLRVGILEKGRLRQANFEVFIEHSTKDKDTLERIHDCVDAAASMMKEYFDTGEEEEPDFPYSWKEYEFNKRALWLQFSTENSDLEAQANALLGEEAEGLVQDLDSDDALDIAEETIEVEDTSTPTIFSGKKKKENLH